MSVVYRIAHYSHCTIERTFIVKNTTTLIPCLLFSNESSIQGATSKSIDIIRQKMLSAGLVPVRESLHC